MRLFGNMSKRSTEEHTKLVKETVLLIGGTKWATVWSNPTGAARLISNPDQIIKYGLPGSPDIIGILKNGKFLGIEVKTGHATQTKKQKNFQKMIETMGGVYLIARPNKDILIAVIAASA